MNFKLVDENNGIVILKTFYLKLLIKTTSIHDNDQSKIFQDLNPTAAQEPQVYCVKTLTETKAYLLEEIEVCERLRKKD